jgi:hypothetical protein
MIEIERRRGKQNLSVRDMCQGMKSSNMYWYAAKRGRDSRFSTVLAFANRVGLTLKLVKK